MYRMSFNFFVQGWIGLAVLTFGYLLFKPAPYGRHVQKGWGPILKARIAWIIMETPVFLIVLGYLILNYSSLALSHRLLMGLFLLHYFNRCFIYPFRLKSTQGKMPLTIVLSAVFFNLVNGNVLGYFFTQTNFVIPMNWIFVAGVTIFFIGMIINIYSDEILLKLKRNSSQYVIPQGGLYQYLSCPNYFGEILEWFGFALAGGHIAVWSFFIWTCANLVPRAMANHKWYQQTFPEYNKKRKAILPFLL